MSRITWHLSLTQEELARRLRVKQPAIAKLERREDVRLSTLRALIEAMGGQIEVGAIFPQGAVVLRQPGESQATAAGGGD